MLGTDVLYGSALELGRKLRARQISPVELAESYLARIEKLDPTLHAFVTVDRGRALAQARRAESEIVKGRVRGPLHGVPYGAKDLFAIEGLRSTWGARPLEEQRFDWTATVIERLERAGAVLLGTVAMIELAGGLGYSVPWASLTGATRNPWDTGRWSCGSSSGSGAAVSAGLAAFTLGSDTWGSIICPASFCSVTGVRPTFGRVSRHGAMPLSWTMDKIGPLARTARDCEAVLRVIGGHDPLDEWSAAEPVPLPLPAARARALTVAAIRPDPKSAEKEVMAAFEEAVKALGAAGVTVRDAKLPDLPFEAVAALVIKAEAASAFEDLFRDGRAKLLSDPEATISNAAAKAITAGDYVKALRIRTLCQKTMATFFSEWDLIVSPAEMMTAPPPTRAWPTSNGRTPWEGCPRSAGCPPSRCPAASAAAAFPWA